MRGLALILVLLVFTTSADARRRHHHHGRHLYDRQVLLPAPDAIRRDARGRDANVAELVPRDWQLQPASPAWQGRRYVSPDGSAWIAFYATNAANDAAAPKVLGCVARPRYNPIAQRPAWNSRVVTSAPMST